ncbi:hypothetical protein GQ457_11G030730 [Hibiscus cannabinus]
MKSSFTKTTRRKRKKKEVSREKEKRGRKFHHNCYHYPCRCCWPSNGSPVTSTTQWFASSSHLFLALNVTDDQRIKVPKMVRFGLLEVFVNGEVIFWFGTIIMKVSMDVQTGLGVSFRLG